jgi:hypothetical protein
VDDCQQYSGKPLRDRFSDDSGKPPFALKIDGISTEPDTWKGLQNLAESTYLSWLALHGFTSGAALAKEIFQSGVL